MPEHLRVAVLRANVPYDGVIFVLSPGAAPVVAVGDGLGKGYGLLAGGGIEDDQSLFVAGLETSAIVPIDDCRTREDGS